MLKKLILVLNCGSSSLKFSIINPNSGYKYLYGIAENLFLSQSVIKWEKNKKKYKYILNCKSSHIDAMIFIKKIILSENSNFLSKIFGIGHRIVHGGEKLKKSTIINSEVIKKIQSASIFAPLHNPNHIIGIQESLKIFPKLAEKNVAVFDTAFHQTMSEEAYLYPIPYNLYKKYGIRRYGAHGINYCYVTEKTANILKKKTNNLNAIICHLGNGSSIAAIKNGICIDTSMGLTPLEGLVMGTRSGDIDPAIIFFLYEILNFNIKEIKNILMKKSGLLGLTETTSDYRYIESNYLNNENVKRTLKIICHRLSKYIGAYSILLDGRLDALVFTGGIGENAVKLREITVSKLEILGFKINLKKNFNIRNGKLGYINEKNTCPILVIPANEELIIAKETARLTK